MLFFGGYFRGGFAPDILTAIFAETRGGRYQFVLAADFNVTPQEFYAKHEGWLKACGAQIVEADCGEPTCTPSQGESRCIDFLVVSDGLAHKTAARRNWCVPFKPHCCIDVTIDIHAPELLLRQIWRPAALPVLDAQAPEPTKQQTEAAMEFAVKKVGDQDIVRKCHPDVLSTACKLGTAAEAIAIGTKLWRTGVAHEALTLARANLGQIWERSAGVVHLEAGGENKALRCT